MKQRREPRPSFSLLNAPRRAPLDTLRFDSPCLVAALCLALAVALWSAPSSAGGCLSPKEEELAALINQYRNANGLPSIALATSLTAVARWHVWDLNENNPNVGQCNLHSWSNARPDLWNSVCYTPDHSQAAGMWYKPREITGVYTSEGFEISYGCSGCRVGPQAALDGWKSSASHNDVILNRGVWQRYPFLAMGVGIDRSYAAVWFGVPTDPAGNLADCQNSTIFQSDFEG